VVTILVTLPTWVVWVVVAGTHQCKDTLGWGQVVVVGDCPGPHQGQARADGVVVI